MQASQRTEYNHALEFASKSANDLQQPVIILFVLTEDFPNANLRHYKFMLEGLQEGKAKLRQRNSMMVVRHGTPIQEVPKLAKEASIVVTDRGYLNLLKKWRKDIAKKIDCPLVQVESDVIVPVQIASQNEEYAAYTFRPKLKDHLDRREVF